jgi:hypothetical protein
MRVEIATETKRFTTQCGANGRYVNCGYASVNGAPYPVLVITGPKLAAELEFLPANEELRRLVVEVQVALADVEGIPHVGRDITQRQAKSMGVLELEIPRQASS